jgi:hypothetical protein
MRSSTNRTPLFGVLAATVTWIPILNRTSAVRDEVLNHKKTGPTELYIPLH